MKLPIAVFLSLLDTIGKVYLKLTSPERKIRKLKAKKERVYEKMLAVKLNSPSAAVRRGELDTLMWQIDQKIRYWESRIS